MKYKIGYTQGTYDMFHIGHLNLLRQAKALCDTLVVGINSDALVQQYKNKTPVVNEHDRMEIVSALRCVDDVVLCDTLKKTDMWKRLHFEAVCMNKKLLTNNPYIVSFPFYNPKWMRIFSSLEDIDIEWIRNREKIDYGYNGEFSPVHLIDYLQANL